MDSDWDAIRAKMRGGVDIWIAERKKSARKQHKRDKILDVRDVLLRLRAENQTWDELQVFCETFGLHVCTKTIRDVIGPHEPKRTPERTANPIRPKPPSIPPGTPTGNPTNNSDGSSIGNPRVKSPGNTSRARTENSSENPDGSAAENVNGDSVKTPLGIAPVITPVRRRNNRRTPTPALAATTTVARQNSAGTPSRDASISDSGDVIEPTLDDRVARSLPLNAPASLAPDDQTSQQPSNEKPFGARGHAF